MKRKPQTFALVDEPRPFFKNFSRVPDMPAAEMMRGDDGALYRQGFDYIFEEGRFKFFNGQMREMHLVTVTTGTNEGIREVQQWQVLPYHDPVAEADTGGSTTLIYEPSIP